MQALQAALMARKNLRVHVLIEIAFLRKVVIATGVQKAALRAEGRVLGEISVCGNSFLQLAGYDVENVNALIRKCGGAALSIG